MKKINKIQVLILALTLVASAFAARLPTVAGDANGEWGTVLNSFLQVAHGSGGNIKAEYITSNMISNSTIVVADIASDVVNTTHIVNGTIINADIASNAINGSQVAQTAGLNISSLIVNNNNTLSRGYIAANISGIFINYTYFDLPSMNNMVCNNVHINMTGIPAGIDCLPVADENIISTSAAERNITITGLNSTYNNCRVMVCNTGIGAGAVDLPMAKYTAMGIATGSN